MAISNPKVHRQAINALRNVIDYFPEDEFGIDIGWVLRFYAPDLWIRTHAEGLLWDALDELHLFGNFLENRTVPSFVDTDEVHELCALAVSIGKLRSQQ